MCRLIENIISGENPLLRDNSEFIGIHDADIPVTIENIKEIRINKGIPQKALADALSVDNAVISNIENGKRELKVAELENIANCLGVEVIDLFTYPEKYVPSGKQHEDVEAVLQIRLKDEKKIEILRSIFGDKNYEILNK